MRALMVKRTALSLCVASLLAGCSLAPEYQRPESPVPLDWPAQPKVEFDRGVGEVSLAGQSAQTVAPASSVPAADIGWREFFRDARLQALIELALENNRDLRVAIESVEEARAQYGIQRGEQWPTIGAAVDGTRQRMPSNMRVGGAEAPSVTNSFRGAWR